MVDQDKKEEIEVPSPVRSPQNEAVDKKTSASEQAVHFEQEKQEKHKTRISQDDDIVSARIEKGNRFDEMDISASKGIDKTVQKVEFLGQKEKIEHLLQVAREKGGEKGLIEAIKMARNMNDRLYWIPFMIFWKEVF